MELQARCGATRHRRQGVTWLLRAGRDLARRGMDLQVWLVMARCDLAGPGIAGGDWYGSVGRRLVRHGLARHGRQGEDRLGDQRHGIAGMARSVQARQGRTRQRRLGEATSGEVRLCDLWHGNAGMARCGETWNDVARCGLVRRGVAGLARKARIGKAAPDPARQRRHITHFLYAQSL